MADVYKIVPLSMKDKVLTVAMGDPRTCRRWTTCATCSSLNEVIALLATPAAIAEGQSEALRRARKRASWTWSSEIEEDKDLRRPRATRTRSTWSHRGDGRGRPGAQAPQHGAAAGDQGQGLGHPLRAVRGRVQDALPGATACSTSWCRRRATWPRRSPAASRSCPTSTSPSAGCRRTAASS